MLLKKKEGEKTHPSSILPRGKSFLNDNPRVRDGNSEKKPTNCCATIYAHREERQLIKSSALVKYRTLLDLWHLISNDRTQIEKMRYLL